MGDPRSPHDRVVTSSFVPAATGGAKRRRSVQAVFVRLQLDVAWSSVPGRQDSSTRRRRLHPWAGAYEHTLQTELGRGAGRSDVEHQRGFGDIAHDTEAALTLTERISLPDAALPSPTFSRSETRVHGGPCLNDSVAPVPDRQHHRDARPPGSVGALWGGLECSDGYAGTRAPFAWPLRLAQPVVRDWCRGQSNKPS